MQNFIKIHEDDNVIVALKVIEAGETVTVAGEQIAAADEVPAGHKMAIRDIAVGEPVMKYGCQIGCAKGDGVSNDTPFLQAAILACPKDGRVLVPEGVYKITSLFLKQCHLVRARRNLFS